jgi:hypothetical protein
VKTLGVTSADHSGRAVKDTNLIRPFRHCDPWL